MECTSYTLFRKIILLFGIAFLMLSLTPEVRSYDIIEDVSFRTRWPDASPGNIARSGSELYIANGNILAVLDAGNLEEQFRVRIDSARGITGIAADPDQSYVYAACGERGLVVVDVAPTLEPEDRIISELAAASPDDPIHGSALDYRSGRVYLADFFYGLRIIDVSNSLEPAQLWGFPQTSFSDQSGGYINVKVSDISERARAFVLDMYYGLRILDVDSDSELSNPILASYDMRSASYFGQLSEVVDLVVDPDASLVYVTDSTYGITILEFDPEDNVISKAGQIKTPGNAAGLALSDGGLLFTADGNSGLHVADVSGPHEEYDSTEDDPSYPPYLVQEEIHPATGAYTTIAGGTDVYLVSAGEELERLAIPDALPDPGLETSASYDPPSDTNYVFGMGDYVYTLDDDGAKEGLRILRFSESDELQLVEFVATPGNASGIAVFESSDYNAEDDTGFAMAYVADGSEGVTIVDISDKSELVLYPGAFDADVDARDIKIFHGRDENGDPTATVYIADADHGLVVAEIGESGRLSEIDSFSFPIPGATGVAVLERTFYDGVEEEIRRYALVVDGENLSVVDVTNPEEGLESAGFLSMDSLGQALDVGVRYPNAAVAAGTSGIHLVDLSYLEDPAAANPNPSIMDTYNPVDHRDDKDDTEIPEWSARAVFIHQAYIHAGIGSQGLLVLGISDTEPDEELTFITDYNTPGQATDVFVHKRSDEDSYTYIADSHGGFVSFIHEDELGGGIDERPFTDSPDNSGWLGCFISTLFD